MDDIIQTKGKKEQVMYVIREPGRSNLASGLLVIGIGDRDAAKKKVGVGAKGKSYDKSGIRTHALSDHGILE